MTSWSRTAAMGAVLLIAACLYPTDTCGCTPRLPEGIVTGVVTRASGAPASGATVRAETAPTCAAGSAHSMSLRTAGTDGRYRAMLSIPTDSACVRVVARDPSGAPADSAVVTGVWLRVARASGAQRPDSVRVDLRLP